MRFVTAFLLLFATTVWGAGHHSAYTGQEKRDVKALSAEEIDGYLSGQGSGLAKAAELNHYPGPLHVLELGDNLKLSDEQRKKTRAVFDQMKREVVPLGKGVVEKERQLDTLFANGKISDPELERLVAEIAALNGKLRAAHLRAHLAQKKILTAEQVSQYDHLRGYGTSKRPDAGGYNGHH